MTQCTHEPNQRPRSSTDTTGDPAPIGEPTHITTAFESDPHAAARSAIIDLTYAAARAGAHGNRLLEYARVALAGELLRERSADLGVQLDAGDGAARNVALVATVPAADMHDVAIKLAAAVRQMTNDEMAAEGPQQAAVFALVVGALADLTVLAGEPITLPPHATEPLRGAEEIAYWRAEATAAATGGAA